MSAYTKSIEKLIKELSKLPGIGPRSAERIALFILKYPYKEAKALSSAIEDVKEKTSYCQICYNLSEGDLCRICADANRDRSIICVVEKPTDVAAIEKTHDYKGLYHVLGGKLSPLDGIGPDKLKINELVRRVDSEKIKEVIIATSSDTEGETTCLYIVRVLKPKKVKLTRL
ncbi:MAG TPA: recombination protein RecR, partial [Candidatus Omnitrophica bacterium]|nr:recombination protein RecR [Candidatus Omnitrophota bacterium]